MKVPPPPLRNRKETGATLRENGLEVSRWICDISARLVVNIASLKLRKAEIESLVFRLEQGLDRTK